MSVTINVSGDLLWHDNLFQAASEDAAALGESGMNFAPMLASAGAYAAEADIGVCHEEVPFAPEGGPYTGYPQFQAPPVIAKAIKELGWDICTTASNHTVDAGWEGLARTVNTLRDAGLKTVGSYLTAEEAETPTIVETADGVKVAFISQTYGLNGLPIPAEQPWSVQLLDADAAVQAARKAKEAGADIVAVHMHGGDEYVHEPNQQQLDYVQQVTASPDVDFVFGEHVHVVQPIDKVNGKWVVYGTGNLIAQSGPGQPYTYDGYMAQITFTGLKGQKFEATAMEWAPTMITHYGYSPQAPARVLVIPTELANGSEMAAELEASAARTREIVNSLGVSGLTERDH
uniref:CapA family protein n=1 Tax=Vaginimicrobium propionicum TaxID=1871034 RepID=UPI00138FD11D|nr:CapA family protein [Vaginimicrobium propionicum]